MDGISTVARVKTAEQKEKERIAAGGFDPSKIKKTDNPYDPNIYNTSFSRTPTGQVSDNLYNADSDVRLAQTYMNRYYSGDDSSRGMPGDYKEYEAARNRVALKKALAEGISGAPSQLQDELGLLKNDAGAALDSSLRSTRKNFNDRGLLYSGLREGGEQQARGRVASALAQGQTEARRESANLVDKRKAAFASIGLAEQEKKNEMANQAFESSYKNSIARRQAMQELAGGIGQGIGMYYGQGGGSQDTQAQSQSPSMENMSSSPGTGSYSAPSYATRPQRMGPA